MLGGAQPSAAGSRRSSATAARRTPVSAERRGPSRNSQTNSAAGGAGNTTDITNWNIQMVNFFKHTDRGINMIRILEIQHFSQFSAKRS